MNMSAIKVQCHVALFWLESAEFYQKTRWQMSVPIEMHCRRYQEFFAAGIRSWNNHDTQGTLVGLRSDGSLGFI